MPVGYLTTVLIVGAATALLVFPVSKIRLFRMLSFWLGLFVNEQPHWFVVLLAASTGLAIAQGDLESTAAWVIAGIACLVMVGLLVLFSRLFYSRAPLRDALVRLGGPEPERLGSRRSRLVTLAAPLAFGWIGAKRTANIEYGPHGKANRLDVYRPRRGEVTGPTLIYLHGGRFRRGDKLREAQPLHRRLASNGWLVISANYRLNPEGTFPDYLIDLKRVIAWARSEGLDFGVDPGRILLAGGSAGAHIAAMAGLTPNHPDLQPGFEEADTAARGVIGLYGYYGGLNVPGGPKGSIPSSPRDHVAPGAPPFLLIHGDHDSVMPSPGGLALVSDLEAVGNRAALAELPGAEHSFDLLRSVRTEDVVDAIQDFADRIQMTGAGKLESTAGSSR
jgi:acetyl esterase/lipase